MRRLLLVGVAAVLLAAHASAAAVPAVVTQRKDLQVFTDVANRVNQYPQFTIFDDVNAGVKNGIVTLTGKVTMPFKREEIARLVSNVDGVVRVDDQLSVLPVSPFDDELRYRIARAIYGNQSFWNYAIMPNPSIHIIVEHGRVTLTGVVNSEIDRVAAQSLATGFGALSVTNDLKTDAELRQALEKPE